MKLKNEKNKYIQFRRQNLFFMNYLNFSLKSLKISIRFKNSFKFNILIKREVSNSSLFLCKFFRQTIY